MKTPAERGPIGAWAYEARTDADLSVPAVVERLARTGVRVTEATLRGIEGGSKKPGRRLLRELATIYGSRPPGAEGDREGGDDRDGLAALAASITRQTEAITALVEELRVTRLQQVEATDVVMRGIAAIADIPAPRGRRAASERGAPVGTAR